MNVKLGLKYYKQYGKGYIKFVAVLTILKQLEFATLKLLTLNNYSLTTISALFFYT